MPRFVKAFFGPVLGGLALFAVTSGHVAAQAPSIAGVSLGMSARDVRAVLGGPAVQQQSLGMRFWEFPGRGITVIWRDEAAGVSAIVLAKRNAGEIRGVRVGDSSQAIAANWGAPVRVRNDGRFLDFAGRGWTLSTEIAKGKAIEITLLAAH